MSKDTLDRILFYYRDKDDECTSSYYRIDLRGGLPLTGASTRTSGSSIMLWDPRFPHLYEGRPTIAFEVQPVLRPFFPKRAAFTNMNEFGPGGARDLPMFEMLSSRIYSYNTFAIRIMCC